MLAKIESLHLVGDVVALYFTVLLCDLVGARFGEYPSKLMLRKFVTRGAMRL